MSGPWVAIFFIVLAGVNAQPPMFANIVEAAVATDALSTLVDAVVAAQLDLVLGNPELEATVFAPTVDAFNETLNDLDMTLEDLAADIELLTDILTYHVVPMAVFASDLSDGMVLPTLHGGNLTVIISEDEVIIDGEDSSASVLSTDITAGMAVVHLIDSVLIP
eukprot:TRINITY_DN1559_c0_g1_i1.p2 TRINITY_DN1559_c0_g1~~TRINITY_DN1559_c0_g1_i1.p2  ORF type:complete len:189 (-),score=25.05 TRINITY_DN1559_c0_g1_i1:417-908(-)